MVRTSRSNKRTAKLRAVAMRRSLLTTFSLLLVTALALSVDLHRPGRASAQAPDIHQIIPIIPGFPSLPPLPGLPGVSGAPTPPTVRNLACQKPCTELPSCRRRHDGHVHRQWLQHGVGSDSVADL
jgi:hypothetical protein